MPSQSTSPAKKHEESQNSPSFFIFVVVLIAIILGSLASESFATEITGFVEANRTVEVASSESGLVERVNVKVGDQVEVGQLIGTLESKVQEAQLDLAILLAGSRSELQKAEVELKTKRVIQRHLEELAAKGFAQDKELLRGELDVEVAEANLLARKERVAENTMRVRMAELNLQRRNIVSPVSGVISEVQKEAGEFISPISPQVVTVLQINPIVGVFQINVSDVHQFKPNQRIVVNLDGGMSVSGEVESIGVIAESETVAVRIRIGNDAQQIRSGQRCYIELPRSVQVTQR